MLPPVDGLNTFVQSCGDFCAIWAAGPWTPVSCDFADESAAIIWGEAFLRSEPRQMKASDLQCSWEKQAESSVPSDGLYVAVKYSTTTGLVVGADLLGLFPVYYYAVGDVILVGSSPELFRHHPSFKAERDVSGLIGILLTNGLFNGRTLWRGVRRLGAGNLLTWRPQSSPKEVRHYTLPVSQEYFNLSLSDHVDILDKTLDNAVKRCVSASERYVFLLSGGLDSRMIAAYLARGNASVTALTDGLSSDIDMKCAVKVAASLGLRHESIDIGYEKYPLHANLTAKWEHLAAGFHGIRRWGFCSYLRRLASHVVSAHLTDAIIGGLYIGWGRATRSHSSSLNKGMSFSSFFHQVNRRGLQPRVLKELLPPRVSDDLISETLEHIEQVYKSYSNLEFQRAWCFDLHHGQRFHVGSVAWALSFGAWPVLPLVTHEVLRVMGGMPMEAIENRHLENELILRRFPNMAKLPLDHSSYDTTPLKPTIHQKTIQFFRGDRSVWKLSRHARLLRGAIYRLLAEDPRYYYRIWNLNNPGWRQIRQEAEANRILASQILDENSLSKLLPPPDATIKVRNEVIDTSGLKCLLGFLLWSKDHFQPQRAQHS